MQATVPTTPTRLGDLLDTQVRGCREVVINVTTEALLYGNTKECSNSLATSGTLQIALSSLNNLYVCSAGGTAVVKVTQVN